MEVKEIKAKTILVKSNIKGIDYVINCYVGCGFACSYCYASFMGRFVDKKIEEWGTYVYPKINAPEVLEKEIKKLKDKGQGKEIFLSSVTDPFQGLEAKYHLSGNCLKVLADFGYEGKLAILTKSPLVLETIPILKKIKNVDVGITVTTTNDNITRYFEKFAPPASKRIEALEKLNKTGIKTYAFIGPLLPHFVANPEELEKLFHALNKAGTKKLYIEHINLKRYIKTRMLEELKEKQDLPSRHSEFISESQKMLNRVQHDRNQFLEKFYSSQSKDYRKELNEIIYSLIKKYNFELLGGDVLYHPESN